jgi:hypothetical protein
LSLSENGPTLEDYKKKILDRYQWLPKISNLRIYGIKNLEKPVNFYETALIEDSYDFHNQLKEGAEFFS